jgi:hypothetical protein
MIDLQKRRHAFFVKEPIINIEPMSFLVGFFFNVDCFLNCSHMGRGSKMSRLEEECIMYVGRNRSGMDAGEIDYGIYLAKFERMSLGDLTDALKSLDIMKNRVLSRITELEKQDET